MTIAVSITSTLKTGGQESIFDTAFVEDDLGIDVISFSVGWTHSIYNPKKLKEYR